jgi:Uma2 family endonuclease
MIESGILTDDDPVELLEGWLVTCMPKSPRHSHVTRLTRDAFERVVPSGWFVDAQEPITTADSEPEPDVMIVWGHRDNYADRHPGPGDIALVVEVADATLTRDRGLKLRLYAAAGISHYWIINLPDQQLEAHHAPDGATYRVRTVYAPADSVPLIIAGAEVARIAVRDLLG